MSTRLSKIGVLAASSLFAVALTAGVTSTASASVSPRIFTGYETGYGATLAAAETDASNQIPGDYYGCSRPYFLVSDGQNADGSWWATMGASNCKGYN